jgi:excisionase family DNA binding protein
VELHEAARRLGVHYQTAYRWVRDGSLAAVKRGTAYEIDAAAVERRRAARQAPTPPPRVASVRDWPQQAARLFETLTLGDELGARAVVDRLTEGGIEPLVLIEELFTPVLRSIGERWAAGELPIAVENRASVICDRLLARVAVHPRGRPRGVAVVTTAPGDDHALPATMAAVVLRADRWQVHHLGPGLPVAELARFSTVVGADVVVITVTNPAAVTVAAQIEQRLATPVTRVLVGTPGRPLRDLLADARGPGRVGSAVGEDRLGGGEAGDRHAVRGAADIVEAGPVEQVD